MTENKCVDCNIVNEDVALRFCPYIEIILNEDETFYLCKKCFDKRYEDTILKAES